MMYELEDFTAVTAPAPARQRRTPRGDSGFKWLILIAIAAFIWYASQRGSTPGPAPTPVVTGDRVLLLLDDSVELSEGQTAVTNTARIPQWCKDNSVEYRRYYAGEDLSKVEPVWTEIRDKAAKPPSFTVTSDGTLTTGDVPHSIDDAIDAISKRVN